MKTLEGMGETVSSVNEPIKFSAAREERRAERQRRRAIRVGGAGKAQDFETDDENPDQRPPQSIIHEIQEISVVLRPWWRGSTFISFLAIVLVPFAIVNYYYWVIASPQYEIETQFSVRGSGQSPIGALGLPGLIGGTSVQSSDSYIVASYIESSQVIRDIKKELGIDLRDFYTKPDIDFIYRIKQDMPIEEFANYWRSMNSVSFNSTTGNVTLLLYGFSAEDAKKIGDAVLKVSENLVNSLSENSRKQMTVAAEKQVARAEDRLRDIREKIRVLRIEKGSYDPAQIMQAEGNLTAQLENQLSGLRTRMTALRESVSDSSIPARMLQRQIDALEAQLIEQRSKLGNPTPNLAADGKTDGTESSIANTLTEFEKLTVEQGFATQLYTSSLAAFEAALAEAQKQERYFATFIAPIKPEVALFPKRFLDSFVALLILFGIWSIIQFIYRSIRDHAI